MRTLILFALIVSALTSCGRLHPVEDGGTATGGGSGGGSTGGSGGGGTAGGQAGGSDGGTLDCSAQTFTNVMIPMRDGKSLAAIVRAPTDPACHLPTLLVQTPYNKDTAKTLWLSNPGSNPLFDSPDYAVVIEDWRGFFGSTPARVAGAQPYGTDGYDTVEWISTQPWSDGNVGTWGVSALCQQQYRTAVTKPPHLKAAVPIFCEMNLGYDTFYPGGVLRREYFEFLSTYFGAGIVSDHPYRDVAWTIAENQLAPADVETPMLVVAGWYDLNPAGSLKAFNQLLASSPAAAKHRLLIGDWIHFATGGESAGGRMLSPEEQQWVDNAKVIQRDSLAFFDLHLRGNAASAASTWEKVRYSRNGTWLSSPGWPPNTTLGRDFYLSADGGLSSAASSGDVALTYDPTNPSPTKGGGTLLPPLTHGPTDQTSLLARGDAAHFVSPPLASNLDLAGPLTLKLRVSTTAADTDFAVRVTDVQPDGGELLLSEGIRRLKLRTSYQTPQAVTPGTTYSLDVAFMSDLAYRFQPGHRVGLIVTGSNYPRFDRNPNTGADFVPDGGTPTAIAVDRLIIDSQSKLTLSVSP